MSVIGRVLISAAFLFTVSPVSVAEMRYSYSVEFELPERELKREMNSKFRPLLGPLMEEITLRQGRGETVTCSVQIAREAHWRINYTSDHDRVLKRIEDLKESLREKDQSWALKQTESDGSWGACYETWVFRLHSSIDPL